MRKSQDNFSNIIRAALVVSFSNLGDSLLYVALPLLYSSFKLNIVHVGILLSANRLVRFISNTFAGYVYGKKPMKWVLVASIIVAFFINLSYGYIEGFLPFLLMRLCWGITWSFLRLGGYLTVVSFSDDLNKGHYMGVYQSISSIGFLSGGLIGGILLDSWGYSSANLLLAFGTFLVMPIAFTLTDRRNEILGQQVQRFNIQTLVGDLDLFKIGVGMMLTKLFLGSLMRARRAEVKLVAALIAIANLVSLVALQICGVTITLSSLNNGLFGSIGSLLWTSKPAPAIHPCSKAFINAFTSTIGPLAELIKNADFFIFLSSGSPIKCFVESINGTCKLI